MADAVVAAEDTDTPEVAEAPAVNRQYVAHTDELYQSLLGSEPMILFFHAEWCPTCRIMEAQIQENWDDFPEGTNILKVNFDTAKDLRTTYNITSQSTVVVLDRDGNVTKTVAFPSTDQLIKLIQDTL
jgi:thiol-disulfide isomerase/thioredoxin